MFKQVIDVNLVFSKERVSKSWKILIIPIDEDVEYPTRAAFGTFTHSLVSMRSNLNVSFERYVAAMHIILTELPWTSPDLVDKR